MKDVALRCGALGSKRCMTRIKQEKRQMIWSAFVILAVFVLTLSASMAFGASAAHAQRALRAPASPNPPALDIADPQAPRDPAPPFGYGGGPRTPRPPDVTGRLQPIFERILAFLRNLFGNA